GSGQPGADDGGAADAAAADHGYGVAASDLAGIQRGAETGHHAAAEQPGHFGLDLRADLGALPGGDQRLGRERPDAQRRRQHGAVGEGHLLRGVVRGEAVPGAPAPARAALSADRPPVQDHEVAGLKPGNALTDRLDDARGFMPEQVGEVLADPALAVMQVGVAHTARLDVDERLARTGIWHDDGGELDRSALAAGDYARNLMCHQVFASFLCITHGPWFISPTLS